MLLKYSKRDPKCPNKSNEIEINAFKFKEIHSNQNRFIHIPGMKKKPIEILENGPEMPK